MKTPGYALVKGWPGAWRCELVVAKRADRDTWNLNVAGDHRVARMAWRHLGEVRDVDIFVDRFPDLRGVAVLHVVESHIELAATEGVVAKFFGCGPLYDEHGEEVTADTLRALADPAQRMSP